MKLRVNEADPVKMRLDTSCPAPFLPLLLTESLGKVDVSGSTAVLVKTVQVEDVDYYDALLVVVTADALKIPEGITAPLAGTASLVWLAGNDNIANKDKNNHSSKTVDFKVKRTGELYSTSSPTFISGIYAIGQPTTVSDGRISLNITARASSCVIDNDYTVRVYGINIAHLLNFLFTEGE